MTKKQKRFARAAGILMPISSLPSNYGIGTLGQAAYEFADFLKASGQAYWQVLPVCPTSFGDSPYQSFSAFAGNPYFIDLDILAEEGLLEKSEIEAYDWGDSLDKIDYAKMFEARFEVLRLAYARSQHHKSEDYIAFCESNRAELDDYCFYMALKFHFDNRDWLCWDDDIRLRKPRALKHYRALLEDDINFWWFIQYKFFEQWNKLKSYVNSLGIEIIGDIPIYVAMDSADAWANGDLFLLDSERRPIDVAGVPPDYFSATGQLWGNPIYDWERMEQDDFAWWRMRMRASAKLYDIVRIDHFIGIVRYYAIPYGNDTAINGEYRDGPGMKLIDAISNELGTARIIAEDLGVQLKSVERLLKKTGYPGMKVLVFAFDENPHNTFLPQYYDSNCVVYGGTHDNDTIAGYFGARKPKQLRHAMAYLNVRRRADIPWAVIKLGYASVADTVIYQMQDYLGLGSEARINYPSTVGGNWEWRALPGQIDEQLAAKILELVEVYAREV